MKKQWKWFAKIGVFVYPLTFWLGGAIDDYIDPIWIWGGNACAETSTEGVVAVCGVPPVGLVLLLGVSVFITLAGFRCFSIVQTRLSV